MRYKVKMDALEISVGIKTPLIAMVDDDPVFLNLIGEWLRSVDMQVVLADSSNRLYEQIEAGLVPDLFVLDYHLGTSRETGLSLCRSIRLRYDKPVIMLTADTSTQVTVACLEAGASQYMTKPCSLEELCARVRVVLRQQQEKYQVGSAATYALPERRGNTFTLGTMTLEATMRQLSSSANPNRLCQLTEKEAQLMQMFMLSTDHTVSRADAFFGLYHFEMEPDNRSVDVLVTKLRKKIARVDPLAHIQSLRGQGYRFIVESGRLTTRDVALADLANDAVEPAKYLDTAQLPTTLDSTDTQLQIEFYQLFIEHVGDEVKNLVQVPPSKEQIRAFAHQMKSSSQSIGARRFTQALLELEWLTQAACPDEHQLNLALKNVEGTWQATVLAVVQQIAVLEEL